MICASGARAIRWVPDLRNRAGHDELAKALSSAYLPISAVVKTEEIAEPITEASGKPSSAMAIPTGSSAPTVASKVLDIYAERASTHAAKVGEHMQQRLRECLDHPLIGEARGVGLIGA